MTEIEKRERILETIIFKIQVVVSAFVAGLIFLFMMSVLLVPLVIGLQGEVK